MRITTTFLLCIICATQGISQIKQLKKAYAQGYSNPTLPIYRAEFKNVSKDKEDGILDWLKDNGLTMSDWRLHEKERFGGNTKLMITWVEFMEADEYNFYQALNKNRASSYLDYLSKPNKSPENERLAIVGLSKVAHTAKDCADYAKTYPKYFEFFRQRAFYIGDLGYKGEGWYDYITYFPETKGVSLAVNNLCEIASSLGELISISKDVELDHDCFITRGNALLQDKSAHKQAIVSFYVRYPNNPQRNQVFEALTKELNSIASIAKMVKANPAISQELHSHAYTIAKTSLTNLKDFVELYPESEHRAEIQQLINTQEAHIKAEQDRIQKEKEEKERIEQERIAQNQREQKAKEEAIQSHIRANSNAKLWSKGDDVCVEGSIGIRGIIHDFNSDKTKSYVKIIGGQRAASFDGQMVYKDETYWISSSYFYKCHGNEPRYTSIPYKQSAVSNSSSTSENTYKYKIGDVVRCRVWEKDSGWDGIVYDKQDGRYQIEITDIISGSWFKSGLQENDCSGNKYLNYDSVTYGPTYIWVPKSCIE